MSLFSTSKLKRNFRRKVVHSISDNEDEPTEGLGHETLEEKKKTDSEGALSFINEDTEEDFTDFKIKRKHSSRNKEAKNTEKTSKTEKNTENDSKKENFPKISQLPDGIPSAADIHAARKKRELARNSGSNLDGNVKNSTKHSLISDDENSDEEIGELRHFGITHESSKQMEVLSALDNAASGSDEEKFIEEQINKGVSSFPITDTPDKSTDISGQKDTLLMTNSPIYLPEIVPISIESLQSQLHNKIIFLKEQHSRNSSTIDKLSEDIQTAQLEIKSMEAHSHSLSIKYQFFQEMKGYVKDLLLCLTEKVADINKLEDRAVKFFEEKSQLLIERRRQDIQDMAQECSGKATDLDQITHARIVEREGRRRRRRELRSKKQPNVEVHFEGQSSDDEILQSTKVQFESEKDELIHNEGCIFSDVLDDFSNVFSVALHFREWKFNFLTSYEQAYISLCLPKILSPYVSLQLILWNPLSSEEIIWEDAPWILDLLFYCNNMKSLDNDVFLIPKIIESTVLPKIADVVRKCWDPLSSSQTINLMKCITTLLRDFPSISMYHHSYQNLFKCMVHRIQVSLENDIFIPIFPIELLSNTSQQNSFSQRQFWTCFKLMNNLVKLNGLIAIDTLKELVLDGLLNRYMLLSLQNCPITVLTVTKIEKIFSILPANWLVKETFDHYLSTFYRYIDNVIEVLQNSMLVEPESNRQSIRIATDKMIELLRKIEVN